MPRKKGSPGKTLSMTGLTLVELGGPGGEKYARQLDKWQAHEDPNVSLKALSLIAPYVWGKPVEKHEHTGKDGGPVRVVHEYHPA